MDLMRWHCHDCFHGMREADTAGGIVVVIDVLRASTTIVTALAHGARGVRTERTPDAARAAAALAGRDAGHCLLGGERGGLPIEGFDLGNSPREYTRDRVAGRRIVTTTTNGTAAVAACPEAEAILIGCLVNRRVVAARAIDLARAGGGPPRAIHLVCAGTDGEPTGEDILGAGAILNAAAGPVRRAREQIEFDDSASRASDIFVEAIWGGSDLPANFERQLEKALRESRGGLNLLAIGMEPDIACAAAIDSFSVVPRLDRASGWFVADR
jgi:2-phosphosulfolactate phosphatase